MLLHELYFEQLQQDRKRAFASLMCAPRQPRLQSMSVRRSVGRTIMQIGAWLAGEPQHRLARSR